MKRTLALYMTVGALLCWGGAAVAVPGNSNGIPKVTICHIPPGNPENAHEITVAQVAALRHIRQHGDFVVTTNTPCPPVRDGNECPTATPTPDQCPTNGYSYGSCPSGTTSN